MTIETLRGRYRLHRFPPRQRAVTGEPLTASISAADYQRQLMDGFQEGLQKGFAQGMTEGQEQGFSEGHQQGFAEGRRQGYTEGSLAGQQEGRKQFVEAAQPLEAISGKVNDFLAHIERKQREDLLQLVEKGHPPGDPLRTGAATDAVAGAGGRGTGGLPGDAGDPASDAEYGRV